VLSTTCRSKVERLITLSTSAVAACCWRASSSSRASRAASVVLGFERRNRRGRPAADRRDCGAALELRSLRRLAISARPAPQSGLIRTSGELIELHPSPASHVQLLQSYRISDRQSAGMPAISQPVD